MIRDTSLAQCVMNYDGWLLHCLSVHSWSGAAVCYQGLLNEVPLPVCELPPSELPHVTGSGEVSLVPAGCHGFIINPLLNVAKSRRAPLPGCVELAAVD